MGIKNTLRMTLATAALALFTTAAFAQPQQPQGPQGPQGDGPHMGRPRMAIPQTEMTKEQMKQMAADRTDRMTKQLGLSVKQAKKVNKLNYKTIKKRQATMKEIRENQMPEPMRGERPQNGMGMGPGGQGGPMGGGRPGMGGPGMGPAGQGGPMGGPGMGERPEGMKTPGEAMREIDEKYEKKLEKILTEEQFDKWLSNRMQRFDEDDTKMPGAEEERG